MKVELGDYTIFAGENNAGKTNIINAIKEHPDFSEYKIIYIPAENNQPIDEIKTSARGADFYKLLENILKNVFDNKPFEDMIGEFDKSKDKEDFVAEVNETLKNMGVNKKEFDVKIPIESFKEEILIKLTKAFVVDLYNTDIDEVELKNIGMGTQRLIVSALIQYYQKINNEEKTLLIFEEPEIYLHPKLKKSLYEALIDISKKPDFKVIITTHDPYFIELGKEQIIYKVFRNVDDKDATDFNKIEDKGFLGYKSDSEINYKIFGIPSKAYFIELFQCLDKKIEGKLKSNGFSKMDKNRFYEEYNKLLMETGMKVNISIEFDEDSDRNQKPKFKIMRNKFAHNGNVSFSDNEIEDKIIEMESVLKIIQEEEN